MPDRPLLILPTPERADPLRRGGGGGEIRTPGRDIQVQRFNPLFREIQRALAGDESSIMELRDNPNSLAPERIIVFDIAGSVSNFSKAVDKVPGLEFMLEYEIEKEPDRLFAMKETRKNRVEETRDDKLVSDRFYLTMPNMEALRKLVDLWGRWSRGEGLGTGYTPFGHVFEHLRELRPWGAEDRLLRETIEDWQEKLKSSPDELVRTEVELWYHREKGKRERSFEQFSKRVSEMGGEIIDESIIEQISYHAALIDIPAQNVRSLIEGGDVIERSVNLALADEIMFLRPQSILESPLESNYDSESGLGEKKENQEKSSPIAALFDGVPVQKHELLDDGIRMDDPDNLEAEAVLPHRIHGTAMASIILHGDLNANAGEAPLERQLYIRPIMSASEDGRERTKDTKLLVDTIYRAVIRMKGGEHEEGVAPDVFLVNFSIGDPRRPFSGLVSPLARLLDFLSEDYGILFLVSAGNATFPLQLSQNTWSEFEDALAEKKERIMLEALNGAKHTRTILSPGESLNALTIGAQHHDAVAPGQESPMVDPYDSSELPNPSSALGLGYRRSVKPEILLPGGREHWQLLRSGAGTEAKPGSPGRIFGLKAAAPPDPSGQGKLGGTALSDGTSSATALSTRSAHRIFDALMDRAGGSVLANMPPEFYAVVVKALLVHGARWNNKAELIKQICGPKEGHRFAERSENITRFLGYGVPDMERAMECDQNRVTLVGYGRIPPKQAHEYQVPLPESLNGVPHSRTLTITLAWFSPIKPEHRNYRCGWLEVRLDQPERILGVDRIKTQPTHFLTRKGTLIHEQYRGRRPVEFGNDGHLSMRVWCGEDIDGTVEDICYGLIVTIESDAEIPIYEQVRSKLRARVPQLGDTLS